MAFYIKKKKQVNLTIHQHQYINTCSYECCESREILKIARKIATFENSQEWKKIKSKVPPVKLNFAAKITN